MKADRRLLFGLFAVILLLFIGWLAFQLWGIDSPSVQTDGFRAWLWRERRFDLLVQMALVFAGALSIAAILPVKDEEDDVGGGNHG